MENKEPDTLISRAINGNPVMSDRIMFGSDMPVVLLNVESYNKYLKQFFKLVEKNEDVYRKMYSDNPYYFLFG